VEYPLSKIKVAYHGVDTQRYAPDEESRLKLRASLGLGLADVAIIATARFTGQKRLDRLIHAFHKLAGEYKMSICFWPGRVLWKMS